MRGLNCKKKLLVSVTTLFSCATILSACGGGSSSTPPPPPPPPPAADTQAPAVSFSNSSIVVDSGGTASSSLSATDNIGVTSGPTVTCTVGAFSGGTYSAPDVSSQTQASCEAVASDAAGNQASATLSITINPPLFAMNGSASKGLIFGGNAIVTDASTGSEISTGKTSNETGLYELSIPASSEFAGDFVKITVSGGDGAEMLCDAASGCGGVAFGDRFSIGSGLSLSAIVRTPTEPTKTVNINVFTDLAAALLTPNLPDLSNADLTQANQDVGQVFGLETVDFTAITPVDLNAATVENTNENDMRAALLAGGIMGAIFENGNIPDNAFSDFKTKFIADGGEIIANETMDDPALISLEDIFSEGAAIRGVLKDTGNETLNNALNSIDDELVIVETSVADTLTTDGNLPPPIDVTPPVIVFNPASLVVDLQNSATASAALTATDNQDGTLIPTVSCTNGGSFANGLFSAPSVSSDTSSVCTATATDAAQNQASATLTVQILAPDVTVPVVTFTPAALVVDLNDATTAAATLTAIDDEDGTLTPTVSCTNGGSFRNDVFTAPAVSQNTTSICTATATDTVGNEGAATLTVQIIAPDVTPPVVTFNPTELVVDLKDTTTAISTLSASDNRDGVLVPSVSCTNDGSFVNDIFTAPIVTENITSVCTAQATDAVGNWASASLTVQVIAPDITPPVVTFDPNVLKLKPNQTAQSVLAALDERDGTLTPTVSCTNAGSFANNTFTAPDVTEDTTVICTAMSTDAAGNKGEATLTVGVFPNNMLPIANAGIDANLNISPNQITLDGSASSDPEGDTLDFQWSVVSQPAGVNVTLEDSDTAMPSFTSFVPGEYEFELVVTDDLNDVGSDRVIVNLVNQAPVLSLKPYKTEGFVGLPITFDASDSTDVNGQTLMFEWEIISAPESSELLSSLYSDPVQDIAFDTSGDFTVKLTVSDGFASDTITLDSQSIELYNIIPLTNTFTDAEYDNVNDRVVTLSGSTVSVIEFDGAETIIDLPLSGAAVSVQPSGNFAAVAHNAFISFINLETKSVVATHPVPQQFGDVVMDDNGFAHAYPSTGQWVRTYTVDMQTGTYKTSDGSLTRHRTKAKLHPSGTKIYAADNGVSPSDVERYDINADNVTLAYDSPYHGDYSFCGDLWMGPEGSSFLTRCGVVVRATDSRATDMTFVMDIEPSVEHASASDFSRLWYIVPSSTNDRDSISIVDADTGTAVETLPVPDALPGNEYADYVFAGNDSNLLSILAVDDVNNPSSAVLIKRYATKAVVADMSPIAVTDRYKTARVAETVTLDGTQSSDPQNDNLTFDWMLLSEPNGSQLMPTGLDTDTVTFTPSVAGVYGFSLRVSDGTHQSEIQSVDVNVFENGQTLVHRIEGGITDIEFSKSLNAFVYLSDTDNLLNIMSMTDFSIRSVPLDRQSYTVGVSPDGNSAAVSQAGQSVLIDLVQGVVLDTQTYTADWGDIVLDHNNRAHLIPNRDQHVSFYTMDFAGDSFNSTGGPYAGSRVRMHPVHDWVYAADTRLSPSDFEKFDVSTSAPSYLGDSPYHGTYPISGNLWISEDGDKILVAGGGVFNSDADRAADMIYAGQLSNNVRPAWADHSTEKNRWAVATYSDGINLFTDDFYTFDRSIAYEDIPSSTGSVEADGDKVFYSSDGEKIFVVLEGSGVLDNYAIQIVE